MAHPLGASRSPRCLEVDYPWQRLDASFRIGNWPPPPPLQILLLLFPLSFLLPSPRVRFGAINFKESHSLKCWEDCPRWTRATIRCRIIRLEVRTDEGNGPEIHFACFGERFVVEKGMSDVVTLLWRKLGRVLLHGRMKETIFDLSSSIMSDNR